MKLRRRNARRSEVRRVVEKLPTANLLTQSLASLRLPEKRDRRNMIASVTLLQSMKAQVLRTIPEANAVLNATTRSFASTVDLPIKREWKREEIQQIYDSPLMNLIFESVRNSKRGSFCSKGLTPMSLQATVHRQHHDPSKIQLCTLLNIK